MAEGQFRFLNETRSLDTDGWDDPRVDRLWRYNLHYFDDLNAAAAEARSAWHQRLIERWIRENPPARGTGWEPFPVSLRITNWIKWVLRGHVPPPGFVGSLAVQTRWVARRLETHLLGNHLLANAKALVFAGFYFAGPEAQSWLERGLDLLTGEVAEQVLDDGGHLERSPMYHALVLEDLLDMFNVSRVYDGTGADRIGFIWDRLPTAIRAMRYWLTAMCHPDGEVSFFNDAAVGIAPAPAEIERYARDLGMEPAPALAPSVTHLVQSGYVRVARGPMVALLDVAPIGPDYLPGHAHADTLSFEMSIHGERVLVNSGTSCYGIGEERHRQRGTAAHNTVVIDQCDSSEVWGGFRVARRARPFDLMVSDDTDTTVACSHDGYRRLQGRPVHRRCWTLGDHSVVVEDVVTPSRVDAQARFHVHPDACLEPGPTAREGRLTLTSGRTVAWRVETGQPAVEASTFHPRFGVTVANSCLTNRLVNGRSRIRFDWS